MINGNQTVKLIELYEMKCPLERENLASAEKVNLMTPENIHINSYMYEPILHMANHHLKHLYEEVHELR